MFRSYAVLKIWLYDNLLKKKITRSYWSSGKSGKFSIFFAKQMTELLLMKMKQWFWAVYVH